MTLREEARVVLTAFSGSVLDTAVLSLGLCLLLSKLPNPVQIQAGESGAGASLELRLA